MSVIIAADNYAYFLYNITMMWMGVAAIVVAAKPFMDSQQYKPPNLELIRGADLRKIPQPAHESRRRTN